MQAVHRVSCSSLSSMRAPAPTCLISMQADPKRWVESYNSRPSIFTVCVSWVTQQMAGGARAVRLVELEARNGIDAKALRAAVEGTDAKYWHRRVNCSSLSSMRAPGSWGPPLAPRRRGEAGPPAAHDLAPEHSHKQERSKDVILVTAPLTCPSLMSSASSPSCCCCTASTSGPAASGAASPLHTPLMPPLVLRPMSASGALPP